MISLVFKFIKHININNKNIILTLMKEYDENMKYADSAIFECPCCNHHNMIKHGKYKRSYINANGKTSIFYIYRYKCKSCDHTHAIIPSFLVPYKRKIIFLLLEVINEYLRTGDYAPEDEYLISCFNAWKLRLKTLNINDDYYGYDSHFTMRCIKYFHMIFLQYSRRLYFFKRKIFEIHLGYFVLNVTPT